MENYQVFARRYRPQQFQDVVGQDHIVQTIKNAIRFNRLAHAYLFFGIKGTGKTTLARLFAKALNCSNVNEDLEPCCKCTQCLEIAQGNSLSVLEIDGASHRGIDDIRLITDSVGYSPSEGQYKIYIIDEVHMLTKEAFNALLKTLEEPPARVKFFFATTEAHKVPETILSRCQRFNLRRISTDSIATTLEKIGEDLKLDVEKEALYTLAEYAEGSLRDAESFFDQVVSFSDNKITVESVSKVLGILPKQWFYQLDKAFYDGNKKAAFLISEEIFSTGKDITHFLQNLLHHYRKILLFKLTPQLIAPYEKESIQNSAQFYTEEQGISILEHIMKAESEIKHALAPRIALEALLFSIMKERYKLPVDQLLKKLMLLESRVEKTTSQPQTKSEPEIIEPPKKKPTTPKTQKPRTPLQQPIQRQPGEEEGIIQFATCELQASIERRK